VLLYRRALSDDERNDVVRWLRGKYSIDDVR
jgi:hypothetical protein